MKNERDVLGYITLFDNFHPSVCVPDGECTNINLECRVVESGRCSTIHKVDIVIDVSGNESGSIGVLCMRNKDYDISFCYDNVNADHNKHDRTNTMLSEFFTH